MKAAVGAAVSARPIRPEGLENWANNEAQPVLRELRERVNDKGRERAEIETAGGGAYTPIWTSIDMPTDAAWCIHASIAGMSTIGGIEPAGITLVGTFLSVAGVVSLNGSTTLSKHTSPFAAINAQFVVSGRAARLEVRDATIGPMHFVAVVETTEVRAE